MKLDSDKYRKAIEEFIAKHNLAVEDLTSQQLAEVILQASKAGDFRKLIRIGDNAQAVIYLPYAELERVKTERDEWRRKYEELLSK